MSAAPHMGIVDILQTGSPFAVLSRDITVRLLNVSGSGCLVESRHALREGRTVSLRVRVDGRECSDLVRITRCQAVQGAGATFRMGAEFLWVSVPDDRSLRAIARRPERLSGANGQAVLSP